MRIKLLKATQPDLPDHVVIKRSTRARRMALRLDPQNRIFTLTLPRGMSLRKAQRFAEEHEDWMQECLSELAPQIRIEDGGILPILGQRTSIKVERDEQRKTTSIELDGKILRVRTNLDDPAPRIKRYLKTLAKERITELAHEKAKKLGKRINKIQIRDTKSRWGSCSEDGNLNFSWRLILAPHEALDYVIAHEVAHLKHMDHSDAFWAVCRKLSDEYLDGRYWMDAHGHELMRYC